MGWLTGQFSPGGPWDYKKNYQTGTVDQADARVFGNFNFGAVLEGLGFSYYFTQNAAGAAQIAIWVTGGARGTGLPGSVWPYGDQVNDAIDILKGFDYQRQEDKDCNP